jgi:hypothetical protein
VNDWCTANFKRINVAKLRVVILQEEKYSEIQTSALPLFVQAAQAGFIFEIISSYFNFTNAQNY